MSQWSDHKFGSEAYILPVVVPPCPPLVISCIYRSSEIKNCQNDWIEADMRVDHCGVYEVKIKSKDLGQMIRTVRISSRRKNRQPAPLNFLRRR